MTIGIYTVIEKSSMNNIRGTVIQLLSTRTDGAKSARTVSNNKLNNLIAIG